MARSLLCTSCWGVARRGTTRKDSGDAPGIASLALSGAHDDLARSGLTRSVRGVRCRLGYRDDPVPVDLPRAVGAHTRCRERSETDSGVAVDGLCDHQLSHCTPCNRQSEIASGFDDEPSRVGRGRRIDTEYDLVIRWSQGRALRKAEDDARDRRRVALVGIGGAALVIASEVCVPVPSIFLTASADNTITDIPGGRRVLSVIQ